MPQSLSMVFIHLTFSTRDRAPLLDTPEIRTELHSYMARTFHTMDCSTILINSVNDHIHALFLLSRKFAIAKVVEEIKKSSSKWIKTNGDHYRDFYWQAGYGAFSVSQSNVEQVKRYIENQEKHHQHKTFQEEFRELLQKHGIEWNEKYVWD